MTQASPIISRVPVVFADSHGHSVRSHYLMVGNLTQEMIASVINESSPDQGFEPTELGLPDLASMIRCCPHVEGPHWHQIDFGRVDRFLPGQNLPNGGTYVGSAENFLSAFASATPIHMSDPS